ncbi:MAG: serine/threonine-protein kinase [Planctomycetota bacterium]
MPELKTHPSRDELSAYSLGQLPEEKSVVIDRHISECQPCCETIVALSSEDTFAGLLQEAGQSLAEKPDDPTLGQDALTDDLARSSRSLSVPPPLAEHPRYKIVRLIGKGGMGDVYEAIHRKMERRVALKVINRKLFQNREAVNRFHREVKTAAQLAHPNVVTSHDADQADDFHFMVMEFVDGVDLSQIVKDRGALSIVDACDFIRQAAVGLQHAHECGMVHRDIKPHNLMVTHDGMVKILDFGIASFAPESIPASDSAIKRSELTAAGTLMGTPDFISPEQANDARQVDIRSDIYSLGMTLYFLLAGRVPFGDASALEKLKMHAESEPTALATLRDDLPEPLNRIIARMIAKDVNDRFQTPAEVALALQPFVLKSPAGTPREVSATQRLGEPSRRWPPGQWRSSWRIAGGAFLAVALAFVAVVSTKESIADKLTRLKAPDEIQLSVQPPSQNQVRAVWYNVEGDSLGADRALAGNTAAICDIGNCRIALLGQDVSEEPTAINSLYLTVAGPRDRKSLVYSTVANENDGEPYFRSEYSSGRAKCRFYDFRFSLTDQMIRYGKVQHVWNDPSSPGLLILVDTVSGKITTQTMKPNAERGKVHGLVVMRTTEQPGRDKVMSAIASNDSLRDGQTGGQATGQIDLPNQAIAAEVTALSWIDVRSLSRASLDQTLASLLTVVPREGTPRALELTDEARSLARASFLAVEAGTGAGMETVLIATPPGSTVETNADGPWQLFVRMGPKTSAADAVEIMVATYIKETGVEPSSDEAKVIEEFRNLSFVDVGNGWFAAQGEALLPLPLPSEALDTTPFVEALQNFEGSAIRFAWLIDDATRLEIDRLQTRPGAALFEGLVTSLRGMQSTSAGVWLGEQPKLVLDMRFADPKDAKRFATGSEELAGLITGFGPDLIACPDDTATSKEMREAFGTLFLDRNGARLSKTFDIALLQQLGDSGLPWTTLIGVENGEFQEEPSEFPSEDDVDLLAEVQGDTKDMLEWILKSSPEVRSLAADQLLAEGNAELAANLLSLVNQLDPRAKAWLEIADRFQSTNETQKAVDALLKAYRIDVKAIEKGDLALFQETDRLGELAEVLTEERLSMLPHYNASVDVLLAVLGSDSSRDVGFELLERIWNTQSQLRSTVLSRVPEEVWKEVPNQAYYFHSKAAKNSEKGGADVPGRAEGGRGKD